LRGAPAFWFLVRGSCETAADRHPKFRAPLSLKERKGTGLLRKEGGDTQKCLSGEARPLMPKEGKGDRVFSSRYISLFCLTRGKTLSDQRNRRDWLMRTGGVRSALGKAADGLCL